MAGVRPDKDNGWTATTAPTAIRNAIIVRMPMPSVRSSQRQESQWARARPRSAGPVPIEIRVGRFPDDILVVADVKPVWCRAEGHRPAPIP